MSQEKNRTYLGIDYGERRIGLAKSDPTGFIASPLETLQVKSLKDAVEQILKVIREHQPAAIVVGYPVHVSGDKSEKCLEIDRFIKKLQAVYAGPIHKEDEQYSSAEAAGIIHAHGQKIGKDKKRLDRLAAAIILQRFLDERPK
jgi:putative Holliday junction resolvase